MIIPAQIALWDNPTEFTPSEQTGIFVAKSEGRMTKLFVCFVSLVQKISMIMTDQFWKRHFGADPGIVGHSILINNDPWTVVGVLPASFDFSSIFTPGARPVDFLRPFPNIGDGWGNLMAVIGRLKPQVAILQAQAEFDLLNQQLQAAHPERGHFSSQVVPLRENVRTGQQYLCPTCLRFNFPRVQVT